ncbi:MAG TPA: hypothetical protein VL201_00015 [Patescibacteria group bacterium]|jgi:hypothetical protein|nr:hypothetical protein [Patescibacteria group bacterium]
MHEFYEDFVIKVHNSQIPSEHCFKEFIQKGFRSLYSLNAEQLRTMIVPLLQQNRPTGQDDLD